MTTFVETQSVPKLGPTELDPAELPHLEVVDRRGRVL